MHECFAEGFAPGAFPGQHTLEPVLTDLAAQGLRIALEVSFMRFKLVLMVVNGCVHLRDFVGV